MGWSEILPLSAALSIDALSIGVSCGFSGIKTPVSAKLVIMTVSMLVTGGAVLCGILLGDILPSFVGKILGALLLAAVGIYVMSGAFKSHKTKNKKRKHFAIPKGIISDPAEYDLDNSSSIDLTEAVFIGLALSADSFAAGIGAGVGGGAVLAIPIICGIFQMIFLCCGEKAAKKLRKIKMFDEKGFSLVSGLIMIFTAVCRLIF